MNVTGKDANNLDDVKTLKIDVEGLKKGTYTASEAVALLGATSDLTAVPASFATLGDVQTYLATVVPEAESRLDSIEAKLDSLINALKTSEIIL